MIKDIAADLFKRLPNGGMTEQEFIAYVKERGAGEKMAEDIMWAIKSMGFGFKQEDKYKSTPPTKVFVYGDEDEDEDEDEDVKDYSSDPKDWYFDVYDGGDGRLFVCLSMDPDCLDDDLGSYNLPNAIKKALDDCWIHTGCESEESVWEVYKGHVKETIMKAMIAKGFVHNPSFGD